jgi:hypothetical protein
MDLKKLLELLGVDSLDETKQDEIKDSLKTIIEARAKEEAETILKDDKETLITEMEEKFEDYKKEITSKFSNFVDSVLEEELVIPEKVLEYARKGELYNELIEQFKIRLAIDEGLLDEEVKDLLREAKKEILSLRGEVDGLIDDKLELELKTQQQDADMHLRQKADGLTEAKRLKVFELLEGVTDTEEIDKKFDLIVESLSVTEQDDDDDDDDDDKKKKCPEGEVWDEEAGKCVTKPESKVDVDEQDENECPEGETWDKEAGKCVPKTEEQLLEEDNPFQQHLAQYTDFLKRTTE